MPSFEYRCPDGHCFEHWIHPTAGGGRLKITYGRDGEKREEGASGKTPPATLPCSRCEQPATQVPTRAMANLKADATQSTGWIRPGWSGVDYKNGPDGQPASHLRALDGQSSAYSE